jgi:hypothetical protein
MTENTEPTRPVPPAAGPTEEAAPAPPPPPPHAAPPPPPPGPPGPPPPPRWAWGPNRPGRGPLLLVLVGVVGLLLGCLIGGGVGFVAGHVTGGGHHARFDHPRQYPGGPGFRRPFRGPGVEPVQPQQPAPATPSPSRS